MNSSDPRFVSVEAIRKLRRFNHGLGIEEIEEILDSHEALRELVEGLLECVQECELTGRPTLIERAKKAVRGL